MVIEHVFYTRLTIIEGPIYCNRMNIAFLGRIERDMPEGIERTALILVGPALNAEGFEESCLYASDYDRRFRPQSADSPFASGGER